MPPSILVRPVRQTDFAAWKPLWDGYNAFYGRQGDTARFQELNAQFHAALEKYFHGVRDTATLKLI